MIDIVFPDKNEKEYLELAEKLGYSCLVLVYETQKDVPDLKKFNTKLKLKTALLAAQKKVQSARTKSKLVFVKAVEDNRFAFEKSRPDLMFAVEEAQPRDFMHQRGSGLNHIMCRLAKENNVKIGFSFNAVLNSSGMSRAQIMGRMQQNIMLCRKFKCKTVIASFAKSPLEMRAPKDLMAFFTEIGMHPKEAKDSLNLF
jgi:ribonuclease P/MRP protein subunit RPP1